jgi:uncharacterized damage-inducible protein DinB
MTEASPATSSAKSSRRLANALERTVSGPMWHGPSLREALDGVTAEMAASHPVKGAHSIWELVLHIATWAEVAAERLAGQEDRDVEARNFRVAGEPTEVRWREAVAALEAAYSALANATRSLDEATLFGLLPSRDHTAWDMLQGVVEHGTYHAGQIVILRKALSSAAG